ncbi:glutamate-gated chloride channel-like isoform X1 [Daphnia pulex]|uniref:glutamate-gated chloride channel-like isoform X1 n=2 Tax=Daphnia pulex TaxID=6669 RepID=UPI001EE059C9|nr:glutamate-gated chloride channel-like isoform X1 [Daphnia pulex]
MEDFFRKKDLDSHAIDFKVNGVVFRKWQKCTLELSQMGGMKGNQQQQQNINFREKEKQILDRILGTQYYDRRIRPAGANGTEGPAIVDVNLMFRSFPTISDNKMEYSTTITFREEWLDERLKFDDFRGKLKYLTLTDPDKVWMPDLFFSNEREGHFHNIIVPNVYVRIFPNGNVLYSIRISLTLSCPMNLKLYPLDRQMCSLLMISYGWTTEDLVFQWRKGDPVQVAKNMHLPRFMLERYEADYCHSVTNTGAYSCLKVNLMFKREFSYYLIQIYIPCCMLVIVSWVSFWLDANAVPARVSLGVTTLLTMATQTTGINNSLPPVSYTKAIDVWTGVCLTFVFGALLEFALVNYASRSDAHREKLKKQRRQWEMERERERQAAFEAAAQAQAQAQQVSDNRLDDGITTFAYMKPLPRLRGECPMAIDKRYEFHLAAGSGHHHSSSCWRSWISKFPSRSKRIDVMSRIIFPVVFALFNFAYWGTYLFFENEDD